jgi:hypothetical protein
MDKMQPNDLHETIAYQIDNMRPPQLLPGQHIGIGIVDETTVLVLVAPTATLAVIRYLPGPDLYSVTVDRWRGEVSDFDEVYCDQLGDLIFGVDAERWSLPFGGVQILDADGNVVEERTF